MLFLTAAYTVMRRGEVLWLKWQDIDFANSRTHIRRNLIYSEGGFRFEDFKTGASQRVINHIIGFLLKELKRYKEKQAEIKLIVGNHYDDVTFLFRIKSSHFYISIFLYLKLHF